jgi:hypothetical protein
LRWPVLVSEAQQIAIDQDVVMAGIRLIIAGFGHGHALVTGLDANRAGNGISVSRGYEMHAGAMGRRRTPQHGGRFNWIADFVCAMLFGRVFATCGQANRDAAQSDGVSCQNQVESPLSAL